MPGLTSSGSDSAAAASAGAGAALVPDSDMGGDASSGDSAVRVPVPASDNRIFYGGRTAIMNSGNPIEAVGQPRMQMKASCE